MTLQSREVRSHSYSYTVTEIKFTNSRICCFVDICWFFFFRPHQAAQWESALWGSHWGQTWWSVEEIVQQWLEPERAWGVVSGAEMWDPAYWTGYARLWGQNCANRSQGKLPGKRDVIHGVWNQWNSRHLWQRLPSLYKYVNPYLYCYW